MPKTTRRRLLQGTAGVAFLGLTGPSLFRRSLANAAAILPPNTSQEVIAQLEATMSHQFYIKIEGAKQGTFKGEITDPSGSPAILGLGFDYAISSPRDAASGFPTGRRQHSPIVVTKEWGAASPQLFQSLVTNENLKTVQFDFYESSNPEGTDERFYTIKLSNAFVMKIEQYEHFNATGHQSANDERFLEDVSFTFQKIEVVHQSTLVGASDTLG